MAPRPLALCVGSSLLAQSKGQLTQNSVCHGAGPVPGAAGWLGPAGWWQEASTSLGHMPWPCLVTSHVFPIAQFPETFSHQQRLVLRRSPPGTLPRAPLLEIHPSPTRCQEDARRIPEASPRWAAGIIDGGWDGYGERHHQQERPPWHNDDTTVTPYQGGDGDTGPQLPSRHYGCPWEGQPVGARQGAAAPAPPVLPRALPAPALPPARSAPAPATPAAGQPLPVPTGCRGGHGVGDPSPPTRDITAP